jgi:Ribosomal protein S2
LKRLERLGPIIVHIVRNGGTILIINRVLDKEVSYLSKVFKLRPFSNVVNVFTDRWIDGAFSNFLNFKFLNLRQLPSLVFLSDFTGSKNLLDEAYFLRIPVVALVDTRVHTDTILQKIFMPLPSSNSIKSLFFFFNFLKHYVEKGLYCRDYVGTRDLLFQNWKSLKDISDKKEEVKSEFFVNLFSKLKRRKFVFYLDGYIDYISGHINEDDIDNKEREKNLGTNHSNLINTHENIEGVKLRHLDEKSLVRVNAKAIFHRGFIQRFKGVLKHSNVKLIEKYDIDKRFFTRFGTPITLKHIKLRQQRNVKKQQAKVKQAYI